MATVNDVVRLRPSCGVFAGWVGVVAGLDGSPRGVPYLRVLGYERGLATSHHLFSEGVDVLPPPTFSVGQRVRVPHPAGHGVVVAVSAGAIRVALDWRRPLRGGGHTRHLGHVELSPHAVALLNDPRVLAGRAEPDPDPE